MANNIDTPGRMWVVIEFHNLRSHLLLQIDPEPLPTTWAAESNENMLQASMWFEQAYHNYTLPTVAQVTQCVNFFDAENPER